MSSSSAVSSGAAAAPPRYHQLMPGMKKTTKTLAVKNLCYTDYLVEYGATTVALFETYWAGLDKSIHKYYQERSKRLKAIDNNPELLDDADFISAAPITPSLPPPQI